MRRIILFPLIALMLLSPFQRVAAQYRYLKKPLPRLQIEFKVEVRFHPKRHVFLYNYGIVNKPQSTGKVGVFRIDISRPPGGPPLDGTGLLNNPAVYFKEGYEAHYAKLGDTAVPVAFENAPADWDGNIALQKKASLIGGLLKPGEDLRGFILSSKVLPGIREVIVEPSFDLSDYFPGAETLPDWDAIDAEKKEVRRAELEIQVPVNSVGPSPQSPDQPIASLHEYLMAQKEQALHLGWIDNQGVANSLNKKLAHAKRRVNEGMIIPAINILHALIHELQAQQGKHVNDNAFALLKANVEFLIFKLESR